MQYREEELPQVQRLPAALRKSVDDVAELRHCFPINGTTLFGEPRPLSPSKRARYLQRKAREREARARAKARETEGRDTGSGGQRAKLERNNPSNGTSGSVVSALPIPQDEGTYHTWCMYEPSTTPVVVDHHGRPTRPRTTVNHPATLPLTPPSTHGLHGSSHSDSGDPVYPHFPYTTTSPASSSTESGSSTGNTTRSSPTTSDQETCSRASPTYSPTLSPPTVWIEDSKRGTDAIPEASIPLPLSDHESSPAQGAAWSEDLFMEAYQSYFIRCDDFLDWSVPPAMLAPDEPVNRELCEALEITASAGYAHTLDLQASLVSSALPEEAYAVMHSSSPAVPSSHSELAHAFAGSSQPLASASAATALSKLAAARSCKSSRPDAAWAQTSRQDRSAAPASSSL